MTSRVLRDSPFAGDNPRKTSLVADHAHNIIKSHSTKFIWNFYEIVPNIDGRAVRVNGTNKRISLEKNIYEN